MWDEFGYGNWSWNEIECIIIFFKIIRNFDELSKRFHTSYNNLILFNIWSKTRVKSYFIRVIFIEKYEKTII